eukprot:XP_001611987.1 hypothetical protein [Babesia bovis T2Bo]
MSTLRSNVSDKPSENELHRKEGSLLSCLVEDLMKEMGITNHDSRTTHLLVDILQRESLGLMKDAHEQTEKRISQERDCLLPNSKVGMSLSDIVVRVSEEDAQIACQQYISRNVAKSSFLQDIKDMQRYANNTRLGVKSINLPPSKHGRGFFAGMRSITSGAAGYFPTGAPPHLPDNILLNTLVGYIVLYY